MKMTGNKINLRFRKHLIENFLDKNTIKKEGTILVEFHGWCSAHICYSYLINSLKKNYSCKVVAYEGYTLISSQISQSFFQNLKWNLGKNLSINNFGVYKQMGTTEFIRPKISAKINHQMKKFLKKKVKFRDKNEIINFKLNKIWIGDLIYDTYLKVKNVPTIDVKDKNFERFFIDVIYVYFYWYNYFKENKVKALIISHSTYLYGMVMRIASQFLVTVYKPTFNTIYKIQHKNYTIGNEFFSFKKKFKILSKKDKEDGIKKAKKEIDLMISGLRKFGLGYNLKRKKKFNDKFKKKTKVMIAMHNFYDSPHVFGKMLFPDFYVWLKHIVFLSLKTDYMWYFKLHPENTKKDFSYIKGILKKNKNIKILSHKKNQNDIIEMGINYVLTCFGSIGFEYAYRGVTVVNACIRNPHAGYNFTLNPKTVFEFDRILLNLFKYKIKPNKREILEFLYMRRYHLRINWLMLDRNQISKGFGWKKNIYRPTMYDLWIDSFNNTKHEKIIKTCDKFIKSKNYKMEKSNLSN